MDSFEFNKIAGGVLFALLVLFGLRNISEVVYEVEAPEHPAYEIPGLPAPEESTAAAKPEGPSFEVALANADPANGKTVANKCQTCHTIEKGGPNKIGPDLWGVVGRPVASHGGFNYSDALQKLGGTWDFEKIQHFIADPRGFVPGTKMSFAGLKDVQDRADVIAFLNTQSDSPLPLPKPSEVAPAAAPAQAEGSAAPAAQGEGGAAAPAAAQEGQAQGGEGAPAPFPPKANNPENKGTIVVPTPDTATGGVGTNITKPVGPGNVSAQPGEEQQMERGAVPLEKSVPEPAAKAEEGSGHDQPAPADEHESESVH